MACPEEVPNYRLLMVEGGDGTMYCFSREDLIASRQGTTFYNPQTKEVLNSEGVLEELFNMYDREIELIHAYYKSEVKKVKKECRSEMVRIRNQQWDTFSPKRNESGVRFKTRYEKEYEKEEPPSSLSVARSPGHRDVETIQIGEYLSPPKKSGRFTLSDIDSSGGDSVFESINLSTGSYPKPAMKDNKHSPPRSQVGRFSVRNAPSAPIKKKRFDLS